MFLETNDGLLIFTLSEQRCALSLSDIERVIRAVAIEPLPNAPGIVTGLINVRGRIMPVLDIRRLFNLPGAPIALSDQMIIARTSRRIIAILVDDTLGVIEYNQDDTTAAADLFPGIGHIKGVTKLKDGIAYIYDLDRFLSLDEEAQLDRVLPSDGAASETDGQDA